MRLEGIFNWPCQKKDVIEWVAACEVCKMNKGDNGLYQGLLQPLPIPEQARSHIYMDFIGLPISGGKRSSWWWWTDPLNMAIL